VSRQRPNLVQLQPVPGFFADAGARVAAPASGSRGIYEQI
jgi:hypothetical protein